MKGTFPLIITACALLSSLSLRAAEGSARPVFVPSPLSPCPRVQALVGWEFPLLDETLALLARGDSRTKSAAAMTAHAISFLAGARHLTGEEKGVLWQRFGRIIATASGEPFVANRQTLDDKTVIAYVGDLGEILVFDLADGQIHRGGIEGIDLLPPEWELHDANTRTRYKLRKLGAPTDHSLRKQVRETPVFDIH